MMFFEKRIKCLNKGTLILFIQLISLYLFLNEIQVRLNLSILEDIRDDIDLCFKLAKEEYVIILPGIIINFAALDILFCIFRINSSRDITFNVKFVAEINLLTHLSYVQ